MGAKYSAEDIQVLEGLEAVDYAWNVYRHYGRQGTSSILWEIVDNGIDELKATTATP